MPPNIYFKEAFPMIKAILLGIIVACLTVLMDRSFRGQNFIQKVKDENGKEDTKFNWSGLDDSEALIRAIIYGVVVAVASFATTIAGRWWILALISLIAMIALMLQYAWWWGYAGSGRLKALIWFLLIQWVFQSVATKAVQSLLGVNLIGGSKILVFIVQVLPAVVGSLCTGSAIVGACRHCDKKGLATFFVILTLIGIILTIAGGITVVMGGFNLETAKTQITTAVPETTPEPVSFPTPVPTAQLTPAPMPTAQPTYGGNQYSNQYGGNQYGNQYGSNQYGQYGQYSQYGYGQYGQITEWWTFYNLTIQNDGLLNDNDFGPNPYKEGWWINEYVNDMLARIRKDPVLGAADIAYFDHIAGTEISGVKYDSNAQKWLDNINARAVEFVKDQNLYNRVVDEFIRAINNPNIVQKIEIKSRKDIKALMYMEPNNTVNLGAGGYGYGNYGNYGGYSIKMPKVIWKSHNEEAYFLVYTVKKANSSSTAEALYKLACGYQPPIEGTGNGGNYGGINAGGNSGSNPGPYTPPSNPKDPTKGTNVGKNDTPGPGPDTNNGVGAMTSKVDRPDNSTSMTYSEYKEEIHETAVINENQKVGGDPNTPTVSTPAGATMSSNADKGTGYGGIDVGTTVESYVKTDGGVAVGEHTETHISMPD